MQALDGKIAANDNAARVARTESVPGIIQLYGPLSFVLDGIAFFCVMASILALYVMAEGVWG